MVKGERCARWALRMALFLSLLAPLKLERVEPCVGNPLCSCRSTHMSCTAVPLHRFPEWPKIELEHLDISMSDLQVIPESALDGLRLQTLVLVANKLHFIELRTFSSMASTLASLDLGYNDFTEVPQHGLKDLKILNWLNLQNNKIVSVGAEVKWNHMEDTLTSLSLSNNQISELRPKALSTLHYLQHLELDGNHIRTITHDLLPPNLTLLKLSNNLLFMFPCDIFYNLPRLKIVLLSNNFISFEKNSTCPIDKTKKVDKIDFSNNKINDSTHLSLLKDIQVRQLILDFNELTAVPLLLANSRIERLSISYNRLGLLHRELLLAVKNSLEHLELEHNKLSRVPDALAEVARLRHLSLAYNKLTEAPALPTRIQTLSLASNFLISIPSTLRALVPGSLRYLDLSYNKISNLLPVDFQDWSTSLTTINLRGNRIAQINKNVFPANIPIKEINLSFNDLYYIHPQAFSNISSSLSVLEFSSTLFSGIYPFEIDSEMEKLEWLSFDNNDFHILKLSDLKQIPFLKYLNLEYNRVVDIVVSNDTLDALVSLSNLRIAYNFITHVHSNTFSFVPELQNLDLSYNRINNLTICGFANLPVLRYLSLAGNVINDVQTETFYNLPNLEIITLENNNLTSFNLNWFHNVSQSHLMLIVNVSRNHIRELEGERHVPIKIFDCSHNELHELSTNFLIHLGSSIRHLIFSNNKITNLSPEVFIGCTNLEILDLHKNNIAIIRRKTFTDLPILQILDLSYNSLVNLAVEQFQSLHKLRYLKLDHNKIRLLPRDVFKNTIIEHLDLSSNDISLYPASSLTQIGFTLRYLDISYNHIEFLDSNIFRSTPFLLTLNIGHNQLTVLSDNTFSSLGALRRLDLSFNSIKANFKELFHNLPNLLYLNVAGLTLKSIPYLHLPNLNNLNLSYNFISGFRDDDVKRLTNIRNLDLSNNRISSVLPAMWYRLEKLNTLDLSFNPITRISANSFKWLRNLYHLNLDGLRYLDVIDKESFLPLISLRSLHIQSWSSINHSAFRLCDITTSLPSLYKLVVHWTEEFMDAQLHGIDVSNIRYLEIRGGKLKRISDAAFAAFAKSQELFIKITETSLTKLPTEFMKHLGRVPQLGLDISNNQLNTISPAIFYPNFTSWSHVATKLLSGGLILKGNPLRCECELAWLGSWLRRWLQENDSTPELRRAVRIATCKDHNGKHLPLLQLHADEAECHASALSSDAPTSKNAFLSLACCIVLLFWR